LFDAAGGAAVSEDVPEYGNRRANPLTQAIAIAIRDCLRDGFEPPLHIAAIGVNGAVRVFRYEADGSSEVAMKVLAEHKTDGTFVTPINVIISDARGEASRWVVRADGTPHMVH
jgi:hypothetical protein